MVKSYLVQVHRQAIEDTWRALSVETGERAVIATLLGGIYLFLTWDFFQRSAEQPNFWLKIAATFAPLVLFPAVYFLNLLTAAVTLRAAFSNKFKKEELSELKIQITDVIFDPNGPTEFYIAFRLSNSGIPSTINGVTISATHNGECILDKLAPRLTFAPLIQDARGQLIDGKNPSLALLETEAERDLIFTFTYDGNADIALGDSGTRFSLVGFDSSGREVKSEFNIP